MAKIVKTNNGTVEAVIEMGVSKKDLELVKEINCNALTLREEKTDKLLFSVDFNNGTHVLGTKKIVFGRESDDKKSVKFVLTENGLSEKELERLTYCLGLAQKYLNEIEKQIKETIKNYKDVMENVTVANI